MHVSKVEVDTHGRLAISGVHDATVKEFHFIEGRVFTIRLLGINAESRVIRLDNVVRIGFQDVVDGTIITDVFCLKLNSPAILAGEPRAAWRALLGESYTESSVQNVVNDLVARYADSFLVVFESAYGGSISAICGEIECL
jgi:hypothetical protein